MVYTKIQMAEKEEGGMIKKPGMFMSWTEAIISGGIMLLCVGCLYAIVYMIMRIGE